jgi:RNA polymerase sigma factor (sigma-70 family)
MNDDFVLLQRFAETRSEDAFAELVRRHLGFVYQAARRRLGGDAHRAEEAALAVFADLARKAPSLTGRPVVLAAWLHKAAMHATARILRAEQRRRRWETLFAATPMDDDAQNEAVDMARLRPVLDSALDELGERDRSAVMLRFFEQRAYAEIGERLALSEDAARRRVERALEKLRRGLARRGLASAASALGTALVAEAGVGAGEMLPAGLAAKVGAGALAKAGSVAASAGALAGVSLKAWLGAGALVATVSVATLALWAARGLDNDREMKAPSAQTPFANLVPTTRPLTVEDLLGADYLARLSGATTEEYGRLLVELWRLGTPAGRARFRTVFDHWCVVDAKAAARWSTITRAGEIGAPDGAALRKQSALAWAHGDLEEALAWAQEEPDAMTEGGLLAAILGRLAETDPAEAVELAWLMDGSDGRGILEKLAMSWARSDANAAWAALKPMTPKEVRFIRAKVAAVWANAEPGAATPAFLSEVKDAEGRATFYGFCCESGDLTGDRLDVFRATLAWWMEQPEGADLRSFPAWEMAFMLPRVLMETSERGIAEIANVPAGPLRDHIIVALAGTSGYASGGQRRLSLKPEHMLSLLELMQDEQRRDGAKRIFLERWSDADPEAALAWSRAQSDASMAVTVQFSSLRTIARQDPAAAVAEWKRRADSDQDGGFAVAVAEGWAESDPVAAVNWFIAQVPTPSNDGTMQGMLTEWMKKDPAAAAAWAERNGQRTVLAAAARATQTLSKDLPAGLALTARLAPDSETKLFSMDGRVKWWLQKDPAAARKFLEETTILTPAEKATWLKSE